MNCALQGREKLEGPTVSLASRKNKLEIANSFKFSCIDFIEWAVSCSG